ncbi:hypothetical protein OG896_23965 [Streptomyces sp. NBC_00669]|uniref:hypothetical protein n=1 Tax=Streptomyces sp. NBC_00669 TaxID=2976011 RepID=UPI002E37C7B7|nr:hypothetical protein [Streptomyces sp. NBC_00669]
MSAARTLRDQRPALDALTQIAAALGHLPPADFNLSPITPGELTISVHDNLDGFERWRSVLGIPAGDIEYQQRPGSGHMTLKATTAFAGAAVELVGFAPAMPASVIGGAV